MRALLSCAIALSAAHHVLAQTPPSAEASALSSIVGPFLGPTLIFAPGITAYDFISAVGSSGPNDETTTYKAYHSSTLANPEFSDIPGDEKVGKQAYATVTIGPKTFVGEGVLGYVAQTQREGEGDGGEQTISPPWYEKVSKRQEADESRATTIAQTDEDGSQTSNVYSGGPMTTLCSYNSEPRRAVCTTTGTDAMEDASAMISKVMTLGADIGWVELYILQDPNAATTTTEGSGAEETGSATGSMTTAAGAGAAQTGSGIGGGSGTQAAQATSTQAGAAAEVTAWVHAVVVVAAAAAMAM